MFFDPDFAIDARTETQKLEPNRLEENVDVHVNVRRGFLKGEAAKILRRILRSIANSGFRIIRKGLGKLILLIDKLTRPLPKVRSKEEQEKVNQEAKHLTLYQFYACPFCVRTRRVIRRLNIPIEYRDAQNNAQNRKELLENGGEIKVPCLRIEEKGQMQWMYESADIIQYLEKCFS